ncbi:hypothetical protein RI129_009672 [Pyrocoelia pectoralis]|uniref:Carboxypeptidase n=1 Tax=Pyrocoelia pectoralis TaxID=417401 RepID=A0AAN7V2Q0_9COLE
MELVIRVLLCFVYGFNVLAQNSKPLKLTPLIQSNQTDEALQKSRVNFEEFGSDESYSGYFTTSSKRDSNMFFWFFPSRSNVSNDPLILCLQGGPGVSSLFTVFMENGPVSIDDKGKISKRDYSWINYASVLYIDNPVDTGFSFTSPGTASMNSDDVTNHLFKALLQFFQMFPHMKTNNLYIFGESYGGTYAPRLGRKIQHAKLKGTHKMNLRGMIIGNGLTDARFQVGSGDFLYQIGLVDKFTKADIDNLEQKRAKCVVNKNFECVRNAYNDILVTFHLASGYTNLYNFLFPTSSTAPTEVALDTYLNRQDVRDALHVGSQITYQTYNSHAMGNITDSFKPAWFHMEKLLQDSYDVLVFHGQLDLTIPYNTVVNYINRLIFPGKTDYDNARKRPWKVGEKIAGVVRTGGSLTEVVVINAGHYTIRDQPQHIYELVKKFINKLPLTDRIN